MEHVNDVAIIGAGFGGLGTAIQLARHGRRDFVVFERDTRLGGTWRDNSYPGCACDVPSHLYSYAFAPNPDWSSTYSGQAEIWDYLERCADRFGIRPHLRLGCTALGARWDEVDRRWHLTTSAGEHVARVLVLATGPLSEPSIPDIPGMEAFPGTVFHSARWNHEHDLTGRRVAVIGTGASAIQFVPAITPAVGHLTLFQRTPPWIIPRTARPITRWERWAYRHVPVVRRLNRALVYWTRELLGFGFLHPAVTTYGQRLARRHLHRQISDPVLRAQLTPSYAMGCKRVLVSNDYWPALTRSHVDVVTEPIREVSALGVVTAGGTVHPADTIILGTGFRVTDPSLARHVVGRNGVTLSNAWNPTMRAHRGTTVAGFPNLFVLLGPNTGLGHTSVVLMIESQIRYLLGALDYQRRHGIDALEPTPEAQRRWTALVDERMRRTVWVTGGCASWYLDATGRNSTIWPGYATGFRLRLRRFRPTEYRTPARRSASVPA